MQHLNINTVPLNKLEDVLFLKKKISVYVLRLDAIHPIISGNKIFKLHYFLNEAIKNKPNPIITFGGAYSNHLAATAYACKMLGIKCTGVIRGEKPKELSPTLLQCSAWGMQLKFISRIAYAAIATQNFLENEKIEFGEGIYIPEGGYHPIGAKGASLIWNFIPKNTFTHICTASGTATTLAGILLGASNEQIINIPVLKGITDLDKRINYLTENNFKKNLLKTFDHYHFGGYAKKTPELINFMNNFWKLHNVPTDFVYTAKMFYALMDKIKNNYFEQNSNILCIHTGGLQGNNSLLNGTLLF